MVPSSTLGQDIRLAGILVTDQIMTREHSGETNSTETRDDDSILTAAEFADMGWPADLDGVDSGVERVYVISSSLYERELLDRKEAQALAFREIADVGRQRTAEETGMHPSTVDNKLRSAKRRISDARDFLDILDNCGHEY